jgi:hypothetical protein
MEGGGPVNSMLDAESELLRKNTGNYAVRIETRMRPSTKDTKKKERERYYLEKLKALCTEFPSGEIKETERPDFLIVSEASVTGLDIVDYIREQGERGSSLRHKEKACDEIAYMAQSIFESHNKTPLQVHLHWFWHRTPNAFERKEIASQIAQLVSRNIPQEIYDSVYIDPEEEGNTSLGDFLTRISIVGLKLNAKGSWSNVEMGFIEVGSEEIQQLISSKEKNIEAYRKNCAVIWLLIVADATHISSNIELDRSVNQHVFTTQFDKALFYDHLNQSVVSLTIAP